MWLFLRLSNFLSATTAYVQVTAGGELRASSSSSDPPSASSPSSTALLPAKVSNVMFNFFLLL